MVAIVIPTLNEEKFIERCLDSVRKQTYPFEKMDVIVVDGGSKDNTCGIVLAYSKRYPNVRLLDNSQKIQSAAFNIGYKNSSAPILIRLDAHALYNDAYIEHCVNHIMDDSSIGNVGGIWNVQPQSTTVVSIANALLNSSRFGIGGASYRVGAEEGYVDTVPFGAFPRKVVEEVGGMREDLPRGEDNEFNHRIRKAGYKILLDPQIVATYYARDTFWSSVKQMYQNGISIGKLTDISIDIINVRHFVPLLFVCMLIVGGVLSPFSEIVALIFLCMITLYLVIDLVSSFISVRAGNYKCLTVLPILFPAVHISYGWGTLKSIWGGVKSRYKYWLLAVLILPFHISMLTIKLILKKV